MKEMIINKMHCR